MSSRSWCRRFVLAGFTLILTAEAAATLLAAEPAAVRRPNVIFLLVDDLRWDALGCTGNKVVHSPNIDALAADGVRFTNMFCTTSICATSRATFLTGQWARRHGIHSFGRPLSDKQFAETFPATVRKIGYRTAFVGKWGLGKMPKHEYDYFDGFTGQGRYFERSDKDLKNHMPARMETKTLKFLESCDPDRPFCLQVSFKATHCQDGDPWPFQPDQRYNKLYNDVTIVPARTATEEHFRRLPGFLQTSESRVRWKIRFANPKMFQKSVKDYYRLVSGVDRVVGSIRALLRRKGLADNTVIIFTGDHGFFLGEHGLAGKWFMHEESIRIPLVIYDPRLPESQRGKTVDRIVLSTDIAPTIVELAGRRAPDAMQGASLRPLLAGEAVKSWRREFFYEHLFRHRRIPQTEGVRTDKWKYVRYVDQRPVYEELFDVRSDPGDERNLAGDRKHATTLADMRARWRRLREAMK